LRNGRREQRRRELQASLEALRAPQLMQDVKVVQRTLQSYVVDWRGCCAGWSKAG
jgi:hypothetical protein